MGIFLADALHYVSQVGLPVLRYPRQRLHWRHWLGHIVLSLSMLTPTGALARELAHGFGLGSHVLLSWQGPAERPAASLRAVWLSLLAGRVLRRRVLTALACSHLLSPHGASGRPISSLLRAYQAVLILVSFHHGV